MKILICGGGRLGSNLCSALLKEENDVILIEKDPEIAKEISEKFDVKVVYGSASHPTILKLADIEEVEIVIAVTCYDEVNLLICQIASSLFKIPHTIARVRHEDFLKNEWQQLYQKDKIGVDVIVSPEAEVARAINDRLNIPGAKEMISLVSGAVKIISIKYSDSLKVHHKEYQKIEEYLQKYQVHIMGVHRNDKLYTSLEGNFSPGDEVYLILNSEHTKDVMRVFVDNSNKSDNILIIGGGNIGRYIAMQIEKENHYSNIQIIEVNKERSNKLAEDLIKTIVINGNVIDKTILEEVNIKKVTTTIAVSNDDKVNIISSLLAKQNGCPRVIGLINDSSTYGALVNSLNIDEIINPRDITVSRIISHTRIGQIRSIYDIGNNAKIIDIKLYKSSEVVGKTIEELDLPDSIKIAAVIRDYKLLLPKSRVRLCKDDRVIITSSENSLEKVEKMFTVKYNYF